MVRIVAARSGDAPSASGLAGKGKGVFPDPARGVALVVGLGDGGGAPGFRWSGAEGNVFVRIVLPGAAGAAVGAASSGLAGIGGLRGTVGSL